MITLLSRKLLHERALSGEFRLCAAKVHVVGLAQRCSGLACRFLSLDPPDRVDTSVHQCSMTGPYLMGYRERASIPLILLRDQINGGLDLGCSQAFFYNGYQCVAGLI